MKDEAGFTGKPHEDLAALLAGEMAAVDALIKAMANAKTIDELRTASRALDRVVMWNYWQVPDLYFSKLPTSYWDKFGRPKVMPKYYSIDSALDLQPAWPITTWWIRDPAAR